MSIYILVVSVFTFVDVIHQQDLKVDWQIYKTKFKLNSGYIDIFYIPPSGDGTQSNAVVGDVRQTTTLFLPGV